MASGTLVNRIAQALQGLRYGSVEIVVHDSKVVRMERHEKIRLETERLDLDSINPIADECADHDSRTN
jgi:hypothetical protein